MADEWDAAAQVAVVIAVRDGMPFILEAVRSALDQGGALRAVVVVDDGSTDATRDALRGLGDARLTVLENPGRGVSSARNAGARATDAPWLTFLDADDRLTPGSLATLLAARMRGCALVYGDYERIDGRGVAFGWRHAIRRGRRKPSGDVLTALLSGNFLINGGVALCSHRAFDLAGGFDPALSLCEDWHLWCKLAVVGPFAYVPARVMDYRVHGNSVMMGKRRFADFVPAVQAVFEDAGVRGRTSPQVRAACRRRSEANLMTYCAQQALRARALRQANALAFAAIAHNPRQAPQVVARVVGALVGL